MQRITINPPPTTSSILPRLPDNVLSLECVSRLLISILKVAKILYLSIEFIWLTHRNIFYASNLRFKRNHMKRFYWRKFHKWQTFLVFIFSFEQFCDWYLLSYSVFELFKILYRYTWVAYFSAYIVSVIKNNYFTLHSLHSFIRIHLNLLSHRKNKNKNKKILWLKL